MRTPKRCTRRGRRRLKQSKRLRIPSNNLEKKLALSGYLRVAGVDEVGRGAWAGPVVAAAVILPSRRLYKIRDSKLLTRKEREHLARKIRRAAVAWAVAVADVKEVDRVGIGKASLLVMCQAIRGLKQRVDYALVDGFLLPCIDTSMQKAIVNGDQKVSSIAAASILAKVERDKIMRRLHRKEKACRKYRFDLNKGYPSPHHKKMLEKHGPSQWHRFSFTPIRQPKLV